MLGGGTEEGGGNIRRRATGNLTCDEICWTTFLAGEFDSSGGVTAAASDVGDG